MRAPLIIAGREISIASYLDLQQRFNPRLGGRSERRMSNGALFVMERWSKESVTLSANGWICPAIKALDLSGSFEVELPLPMTLYAGDSLPAGFSARSAPYTEKTIIDPAGVSCRLVWVKAQFGTTGYSETSDHSANFSWELQLEQV